MSKRITITHTDDVSCQEAVTVVECAITNNIKKGECFTFSNNIAVDMARDTKFPSYYVWRIKNK
jgi:hypothetical protein